jgi:colanic acid/amylovoran biosynthesis protein
MVWRMRQAGMDVEEMDAFFCAFREADLIVASGGGYIADVFEPFASEVLDVLALAIGLRKPTAMFGQGIGPLESEGLVAKAKAVLPRVDLIAVREEPMSRATLKRMGVSMWNVVTTGDDAIEMAHRRPANDREGAIGVGLRMASYSEVTRADVMRLRPVLQAVARSLDAPLVPLPISSADDEADERGIRELLAGHGPGLGGDEHSDSHPHSPVLRSAIQQAGRCRLVVTGSYHAAVFALAQGVPVAAIARSGYYRAKFLGLADQFGHGCDLICLDDEQLEDKLTATIRRLWMFSDEYNPGLRKKAQRQIDASHTVYQRLYELIP